MPGSIVERDRRLAHSCAHIHHGTAVHLLLIVPVGKPADEIREGLMSLLEIEHCMPKLISKAWSLGRVGEEGSGV